MFCRTCKKELVDQAVVCVGCGCPPRVGTQFCWKCGAGTHAGQAACTQCGVALSQDPLAALNNLGGPNKSKVLAGALNLAPLVGIPGGIGRLYAGYIGIGIAQLLLSFVCVGMIWSIVDGIMILTGSLTHDADGKPMN